MTISAALVLEPSVAVNSGRVAKHPPMIIRIGRLHISDLCYATFRVGAPFSNVVAPFQPSPLQKLGKPQLSPLKPSATGPRG